jgi:FkbM family methyltransferase
MRAPVKKTSERIAKPAWRIAHGTNVLEGEGSRTLYDSPGFGWHLLETVDPGLTESHVTLHLVVSPADAGTTRLYLNHYGGYDIVSLSRDGELFAGDWVHRAHVAKDGKGCFILSVSFNNYSDRFFLGCADGQGRGLYSGSGAPQWHILEASLHIGPRRPIARETQLVFVEVGAAGAGADEMPEFIYRVMIEPDYKSAAELKRELHYPDRGEVIEAALSDKNGRELLNVTRFPFCSSLLEPDLDVLGRYAIAPCFEVVERVEVTAVRYDSLDQAPPPDVIKIDVQGAEAKVLAGFGALLDGVLGVELEAHLYPIYKEQKLLGDLISMLAAHGLRLRNLLPQRNFDSEFVEVNAWFTRGGVLPPSQAKKLRFVERLFHVEDFEEGRRLARAFESAGG